MSYPTPTDNHFTLAPLASEVQQQQQQAPVMKSNTASSKAAAPVIKPSSGQGMQNGGTSNSKGDPPAASAVPVPLPTKRPHTNTNTMRTTTTTTTTRDPSGVFVQPNVPLGLNKDHHHVATPHTHQQKSGGSVSSTKATLSVKKQPQKSTAGSTTAAVMRPTTGTSVASSRGTSNAPTTTSGANFSSQVSSKDSNFSSQVTTKNKPPPTAASAKNSTASSAAVSSASPSPSSSSTKAAPAASPERSGTTTTTSPVAIKTTNSNSLKARADAKISSEKQQQSFLRKRRQVSGGNANGKNGNALGEIELEEEQARKTAAFNNNPLLLFFTNFAAAIKVFVLYLVTIDTIVCNAVTVGMTIFWWEVKEHDNAWHGAMSFVLVTFAVASPISVAIRMAFDRREKALLCIANIRSFALHIYYAHALWDWKGMDGRINAASSNNFDFEGHCDQVLEHLIGIGDEMTRFLTLPTFSKPRHRVLGRGRVEAAQSLRVAYHLLDSTLLQHMTRLTVLAERLKAVGLSGSEISRIRQYERHMSNQLEQLRMYKVYRTPQALWAFARIFTLLLPPFYAPTFTEVARELGHLWLGIAFAIITATCLTALFESVQILEDPFTAFITLDGIDVSEELEVLQWTQLINARKLLFPQCAEYPLQTRPAISMTGQNSYDPSVHYHSSPELREMLMGRNFASTPVAVDGGGNSPGAIYEGAYDNMFVDEEEEDLEVGKDDGKREAPTSSARTRRRSHFALKRK